MKQLSDNTIIKRKDKLVFNKLDDEIVMMSITNGEYYGLDAVATFIWENIETPCTFSDLIEKLTREFDVDKAQCTKDVSEFLTTMEEKNLLTFD